MVKVALLGAAGGIGQPLALLLKSNAHVTSLSLYDLVATPGVAADLSHINTNSSVTGYLGDSKDPSKDQLSQALSGAQVVIITAGIARKPGMTRDDLFNINAGIIANLAAGVAKTCPNAHILVITNPVNSTVPIVSEVMRHYGVYNPRRIYGVTTLDVVRASTFAAQLRSEIDPAKLKVCVVGGHSGNTIVPLFSQSGLQFTSTENDEWKALVNRVQFGGDEVVKAKDGAGSATLSMAYAGARFANALFEAMSGKSGVVECAYVKSDLFSTSDQVDYFASNIELSADGIAKIHPVGAIAPFEQELLKVALAELKTNIAKGTEFAKVKTASL